MDQKESGVGLLRRKCGGPPKEKVEWAKGILNGAKSGVEKSSILEFNV